MLDMFGIHEQFASDHHSNECDQTKLTSVYSQWQSQDGLL